MSPARHFRALAIRAAWLILLAALVAGAWLVRGALNLPARPDLMNAPSVMLASPSTQASHAAVDWNLFQAYDGGKGTGGGAISARFRLAGTFFAYGEGAQDTRRAVLDDLRGGTQRIVSEAEHLGDVEVVKIYRDRVVLRDGGGEEQLWLTFSKQRPAGTIGASTNGVEVAGSTEGSANRFGGRQVGEHRWVFDRQALLDYYQELRDEPERLVKVFSSLKPVRGEKNRIDGYRLKVDGEEEFFAASGLLEGDVVKKVNNMEMRTRTRAEFLISQFVMDYSNVFMFDVERNGEAVKLIYEIR